MSSSKNIFNFFSKNIWIIKKVVASLHHNKRKGLLLSKIRVISSAGSEHLAYTERVGGSNPS